MKTLEGKKLYASTRSKGLGENEPEMMWLTTMNPETRRLIKVMPEDAETTAQVFRSAPRRQSRRAARTISQKTASKYLELADIS